MIVELGKMCITRGVCGKMKEDKEFMRFCMNSLGRHASGDWGCVCDKRENDLSLATGGLRLISAYEYDNLPKIWIITESDRSVTTILFPEEY